MMVELGENFLAVEVELVKTRPLPMKLANALERQQLALSAHEVRVLRLIARGLSRREIAHRLGCSENTIKSHMSRIYIKLGAGNRSQAVWLAAEQGYLMEEAVWA